MSLNDSKIRNLKPSAKPFNVSDSRGLYLHVKPTDSRIWHFRYYFFGKERRIALGAYPLISLSETRKKRDELRKLLAQNINSAQQRAAEKAARSPTRRSKNVILNWNKSNRLEYFKRYRTCSHHRVNVCAWSSK